MQHRGLHDNNFDRWELNLSILSSVAIIVLSIGLMLLMYPLVFSSDSPLATEALHNEFFGFGALSALLAMYVVERELRIIKLRRQISAERLELMENRLQASVDLLKSIPKRASFQDRLSMEYRRSVTTSSPLSVIVISVNMSPNLSRMPEGIAYLGDATRAISRKLRERDSIYLLRPSCFGVLLPEVDSAVAQGCAMRMAEGLTDSAGIGNRYVFEVNVVSYPSDASSDHQLQEIICGWVSRDTSMLSVAEMLN